MKAFSLEGHSALVTGSSQGIGLAVAEGLLEAGAGLVCHGLQERPAEVPAAAAYVQCDLMEKDAPRRLVEAACAARPDLDTLVCNAGSFFDSAFLDMDEARWDRTLALNLKAAFFLIQAFARHRVAQGGGGSVVIISSTNGFQAEEDSVAYDTSKGGLVMMTKSLAVTLAPHRIRVNGVAPGLIRTPLTGKWMNQPGNPMVAHYEKKILLGEIGRAEDCAGAVVFLCSQAGRYVTGETVIVDGGLTTAQIGRV